MVRIQAINHITGRRYKRPSSAIKDFYKMINNMGKTLARTIPQTLPATVSNMTRARFKENYINHEGWDNPTLSRSYAAKKQTQFNRKDSFRIGSFGVRPVTHGREIFGQRTDTLLEAIDSRSATTFRFNRTVHKRGGNINIRTGLNPDMWDGGTTQIFGVREGGKERKDYPVNLDKFDGNQLWAFSKRITPTGQAPFSILVTLKRGQKRELADYMRIVIGPMVKSVRFLRESAAVA